MWKLFRARNTKKGLKSLEKRLNEFYIEISCKECAYTMTFLSTRMHVIAILDYEITGHPHFYEPN